MSANSLSYRPDVDGLRAVAVLSVVFCHAGFHCPGGFIGVDVFFVISGYLIAGLILKELKQGTFTLANFWERRIRRILPALTVVVAATFGAGWFILMPEDFASFGKSVIGLALLASNVQFWRSINYFNNAAEEKPLLHTWSLSVEEQFYLLVPVFLLLLARRSQLHRAFLLLAAAAALSFGLSVYWTHSHASSNFYLLPTRAWELFAGALLAFSPACGIRKKWVNESLAVLGMALILVPCFVYDSKTPFPGLTALPPVLGSALLIWVGSSSVGFSRIGRLLASKPVVFVGLISYSLYLWHWPLFSFTRYVSVKAPSAMVWWTLIAASIVLATLSWRFVETPFRRRKVFAARPQLFAATAVLFVVMLGSGVVMFRTNGFDGRVDRLTRNLIETGKFDQSYVRELEVVHIPDELVRLGVTNVAPSALIWGDSHAMAVLPVIDSICKETGVAAVAATHAGTPPVVGYFSRNQWGLNEQSLPFNAAVMDYIKKAKLRNVILISYWNMHSEVAEFRTALLKTVEEIRASGAAVYLMRDVPIYEYNILKVLVRSSYKGEDLAQFGLTRSEFIAADKMPATLLEQLKSAGVQILDPIPLLMERSRSEKFLPYDSGGSFYYDGNHLSTYGSLALKPMFTPLFRPDSVEDDVPSAAASPPSPQAQLR
ncbi:MAG TPA: acyltransferase family protein [Verrucomicrobiae bacterium]|nr:acyltransferase family protein [Verrucomicrobiae bacterium]